VANPDLTYTYNRLGQTLAVTDANGSRTFAYDAATTLLQTETLPAFLGSRILTPKYDTTGTGTKGRSTGFSLGVTGTPTGDYDVTYGYDAYGRASTISLSPSLSLPAVTFTYAYTPGSNLVGSVTDGTWSQTRTWLANRDLLDKIETRYSILPKAAFDYDYDELGRRAAVVQTGEMFNRYTGSGLVTKWTYDDRNEVASARTYQGQNPADTTYLLPGRSFGYEFDPIGNRTTSTVDDQTTGYTHDSTNQLTARTTPGKVNVSGLAPTGSTVQANGQATTRQGDYYHKALDVTNTSGPVWTDVTVTSTSPGGSVTRKVFLPKASLADPEKWQYDADGNLTRDDQWSYTWDAENRLIAMQTRTDSGFVIPGPDAKRVDFAYDYLGRRSEKIVRSNWNGTVFTNTVSTTRFIYRGSLKGSCFTLYLEYPELAHAVTP